MSFDTYMKFEGALEVKGESTATGFEGQTEIFSFSFGASNPVTVSPGSSGLAAGRVSISSFNVMKKTESSSAVLFTACCSGQHFTKCIVTLRKATGTTGGQANFLIYTFEDVMIESIQWSGSTGGDDTPTESLSLAFGKVTINYFKQSKKSGEMKDAGTASWDLTTVTK